MKIRINKIQHEYLKETLSIYKTELLKNILYFSEDGSALFEITEDQADEISDWAGERLQKFGFDKHYKLTEEGIILEQLEDLFLI